MNKRDMTEGMTPKQKAGYYWYYYKWFYLLAVGAVLLSVFIGVTITEKMNREIVLHLTLVGANSYALDQTDYFDRFLETYGYSDRAELEIEGNLSVNLNGSDVQSANTLQLLAANFISGDIDVFTSDLELFKMESEKKAFLNLEEILTEEQLASISDLLWYGTDWDTGREVPVGIRISNLPIVTEEQLYDPSTEPVMGVAASYSVEEQDITNYIEYVVGSVASDKIKTGDHFP